MDEVARVTASYELKHMGRSTRMSDTDVAAFEVVEQVCVCLRRRMQRPEFSQGGDRVSLVPRAAGRSSTLGLSAR